MSNIKGRNNGGSFSSGNNIIGGEEQQELITVNCFHSSSSLASSTTNSNGSITQQHQPPPVLKKKRNLPGTPDPTAEVIALSPHTLMATNRFVCEICSKGFQRDQNLQLHRRGHNLPWKLKQRTSTEIRKRVYICPEPSCVHHNPARALGDLTGVKKHFSRKHGEKKWKCDKCSKRYAVQSDWKAHSKTCGTKEYRCDCGTIFCRRDSFITHRAFCDALTEENNKANQGILVMDNNIRSNSSQGQVLSHEQLISSTQPINNNNNPNNESTTISEIFSNDHHQDTKNPSSGSMFSSSCLQLNAANSSTNIFEGKNYNNIGIVQQLANSAFMSATALLQKAAQMGATTASNNINVITSMAPPSFGTTLLQQQQPQNDHDHDQLIMEKGQVLQEISSRFFNGINGGEIESSSMSNNRGMFAGDFDQNINNKGRSYHNSGLSTNVNPSGNLSRFSGDVTTVDFLGISGSRTRNLHDQQEVLQQEIMGFGGIGDQSRIQGLSSHHFQQHAATLEKPMWEV